MKILSIKNKTKYLEEYIKLCYLEWSNKDMDLSNYIEYKKSKILKGDNVISILGLIDNDTLIGFISLFKQDGEERKDLTP